MKIQLEEKDILEIVKMARDRVLEKCALPLNSQLQPEEEEYFTSKGAANFLGKSTQQIYQWVNQAAHGHSDFPYMKTGKSLRFSKNELLTWMKKSGRPLGKCL